MSESRRIFRQKYFNIFHLSFWFLLGLLALLKSYGESVIAKEEFNWYSIIIWPFAHFFAAWVVSNIVIYLYATTNRLQQAKFILFHIISAFGVAVIHLLLTGIVILLFERLFEFPESIYWLDLPNYYTQNAFDAIEGVYIYVIVLIAIIGIDYFVRYKQQIATIHSLHNKLVSSELQTLKLQLKPHFLFNALNTIAMMVRREKDEQAVEMLSGLSDMMRNSMSKDKKLYVTVAEEIELINAYLKIEATRFQDRLKIIVSVEDEIKNCKIPNLILQPIVENAFKHGISNTINQATLEIIAKKENNQLTLSVFNTGSSLPADWDLNNSKGIGIINTTHRLRQMYQGHFKFLVKEENNGVLFKMIMPINR